MNTRVLTAIAGIGALAALIGIGIVTIQPKHSTPASQQPPATTAPAVPAAQPAAAPAPGVYTNYTSEAIKHTSGTKVLFFHASWCPQCRALDASITTSEIPHGVTIFKTDYDSNQALRQKYGVTVQTTFVKIDDAGNLVATYVAYDRPEFQAVKENLLQ